MAEHRASKVEDHSIAGDSGPMLRTISRARPESASASVITPISAASFEDIETPRPKVVAIAMHHRSMKALRPVGCVAVNDQYVDDVFEGQWERERQIELYDSHPCRGHRHLHMGPHEGEESRQRGSRRCGEKDRKLISYPLTLTAATNWMRVQDAGSIRKVRAQSDFAPPLGNFSPAPAGCMTDIVQDATDMEFFGALKG